MNRRMLFPLTAAVAAGCALAAMSNVGLAGQGAVPAGTDAVKAFIASRVANNFDPPKTPWGHPDISGVFTTKDEANTPLERPAEWAGRRMDDITPQEFAAAVARRQERAVEAAPFAGGGEPEQGVSIAVPIHWFDNLAAKNSRPWFIIDPAEGKIPPRTPEAMARAAAEAKRTAGPRQGPGDVPADRDLNDRCIAWGGGPWHMPIIYGNSYQILQTPDYVVMRYEMIHEARMIPLDGRPQVNAGIRSYFGTSRGRWEGNSLVVETTNFLPRNASNQGGVPYGLENLRLTERFTRIAPNKVEWTVTYDDPSTWTRPWTYSFPLTEDNSQIIFEYACHEGNYGMANLLSGARLVEKGTSR